MVDYVWRDLRTVIVAAWRLSMDLDEIPFAYTSHVAC